MRYFASEGWGGLRLSIVSTETTSALARTVPLFELGAVDLKGLSV
jgi:hypothetical protein